MDLKNTTPLNTNWRLRRVDPKNPPDMEKLDEFLRNGQDPRDKVFNVAQMPAQVHEILIAEGIIENPNIQGDGTGCLWVSESDWLYVCDFPCPPGRGTTHLDFDGLDTYVDIYLNGSLIASHKDVYLPCRVDITGRLQAENRLALHFHAPKLKYDAVELPSYIENADSKIKPGARTRMFGTTFGDYLGPKPYLMRVGVYGDIRVTVVDEAEIASLHTPYRLSDELDEAVITVKIALAGETEGIAANMTLFDPNGESCGTCVALPNGSVDLEGTFTLVSPQLWWPRTHGPSPLYRIDVELVSGARVLDSATCEIGLRRLTMKGDFDFSINGLPLKLWGSNLAPLDTLTNVYNTKHMSDMLDIAELAHHNCIRVWGENERLDDDFYAQCDRRGILIWQDFFTTYSMYAPDPEMYELIRREADYQVRRLRDHACILLWCGGNESLMSRDYEFPGEEFSGLAIFNEIFPSVCAELDPERYYHRSSPDGGAYANDPLGGDTHGYTHIWYVPGNYHPVFLSENCRVSTPAKRTMQRMMKPEDLWPTGYDGMQHKNSELPWPEQWNKYNSNMGYWKLGDIESYYDATDLDAQLYRIGWGHGDYLRRRVERYRRGRPLEASSNERITKGHLLWKLNNSSNHIFFGVIDYFMEPFIPYYALKRAYEPVLLSFETGNFIHLWMVNDTTRAIRGRVFVGLFDPLMNRMAKQFELPFSIAPDESKVVTNLNQFGQFKKNHILFAYAVADDGRRVAESIDYVDIERHMRFPTDGHISMSVDNGSLVLTSDRYERSVELVGNHDGDEFGWLFEDNYFDLIPGQIKRVRVLGRHDQGRIAAKSYYGNYTAEVEYRR